LPREESSNLRGLAPEKKMRKTPRKEKERADEKRILQQKTRAYRASWKNVPKNSPRHNRKPLKQDLFRKSDRPPAGGNLLHQEIQIQQKSERNTPIIKKKKSQTMVEGGEGPRREKSTTRGEKFFYEKEKKTSKKNGE